MSNPILTSLERLLDLRNYLVSSNENTKVAIEIAIKVEHTIRDIEDNFSLVPAARPYKDE